MDDGNISPGEGKKRGPFLGSEKGFPTPFSGRKVEVNCLMDPTVAPAANRPLKAILLLGVGVAPAEDLQISEAAFEPVHVERPMAGGALTCLIDKVFERFGKGGIAFRTAPFNHRFHKF